MEIYFNDGLKRYFLFGVWGSVWDIGFGVFVFKIFSMMIFKIMVYEFEESDLLCNVVCELF